MSPLVEARMSFIPCQPGCDWRDLPNKAVKLRDGSMTKILLVQRLHLFYFGFETKICSLGNYFLIFFLRYLFS